MIPNWLVGLSLEQLLAFDLLATFATEGENQELVKSSGLVTTKYKSFDWIYAYV